MIPPQLALVRPRVVSPESGASLPLEIVVADLLESGDYRVIQITGGTGAGKTTALAHLAAIGRLGPPLEFLDEPLPSDVAKLAAVRRVVCTSCERLKVADVSLSLAPWTDDELIEYLLAVRPDRCAAALACIRADPDRAALRGNPALWTIVLDALVADQPLASVRSSVEHALAGALRTRKERRIAAEFCLAMLQGKSQDAERLLADLHRGTADHQRVLLLRHPFVQQILAGERVARWLLAGGECRALDEPLPVPLASELARRVLAEPNLGQRLQAIFDGSRRAAKPQAATILFKAYPKWRPPSNRQAILTLGVFPEAAWSGLQLPVTAAGPSHLSWAYLRGADLSGAVLDGTRARQAHLAKVRLDKASLVGVDFSEVDLSGANMIAANADRMDLRKANLQAAVLDDASLIGVDFDEADLRGASFRSANLVHSVLLGCEVDGADFRDANLSGCFLRELVLREAELAGACFREADLSRCDLERVRLEGCDFSRAKLHSALLTGSQMPWADLRDADLRGAGLADIHWENADLRGADLRGCTFHMGSTRSGLVGSPYPGHGSKTGFYTDDYYDQGHKLPEEIRKANLCGADLRGATLDGVDFYLVDLRGAIFDSGAAEQLTKCGAILIDR